MASVSSKAELLKFSVLVSVPTLLISCSVLQFSLGGFVLSILEESLSVAIQMKLAIGTYLI